MDYSAEDMFGSGGPDGSSKPPPSAPTGRPSAPPPPVPGGVGDTKSTNFADEMMKEFEAKQSDLSLYSDDMRQDNYKGLGQEDVAPSTGYGFQSDAYGLPETKFGAGGFDPDRDFEALEARFMEQEIVGDVETTRTMEIHAFSGAVPTMTESSGAGDVRQDLFEQSLDQFDGATPNMMSYGFGGMDAGSKVQDRLQEVPSDLGFGQSVNTFGAGRKTDFDDDEDDFDRDSISQSQPSQQMSSKLCDSLEALKDIPKEMPAVPDHFSAHGVKFGRDDEDEFEKDSISSHPISSKLSDSLEVLKDSPPKDVRMDESLMDVDEFPSSKNSVNSISPNDAMADELVDSGPQENLSNLTSGISSMNEATNVSESDQSGSPFENLSEEIKNMPSGNRDFFADNNDFGPGDTSGLSRVAESNPFGDSGLGGGVTSSIPEVTSSSGYGISDFSSSNFQEDSLDMFNSSTATEVADSLLVDRISPQPPPIPPHRNLTFESQMVSDPIPIQQPPKSEQVQDDLFSFTSMNESNIADVKNPFEYSQTHDFPVTEEDEKEVESVVMAKKQEMGDVEADLGTFSQGLSDADLNQQSVTEDLEDFLPQDKEPLQFERKEDQVSKRDSPVFSTKSEGFDLIHQMESDELSFSKPQQPKKPETPEPEEEEDQILSYKSSITSAKPEPKFSEPEPAFEFQNAATKSAFQSEPVTETFEPEPFKQSFETEPVKSSYESQPVMHSFEPEPQKPSISVFDRKGESEAPEPSFEPEFVESKSSLYSEATKPTFYIQDDFQDPSPAIKDTYADFMQDGKSKSEPEPEVVKPEPPRTQVKKVETKVPEPRDERPKLPREQADIEISEEVQQILNIMNPRCWFQPEKLHPAVSELVYWRDPKKSGVVFGSIFLVLIFLTFASFISVVAYTSLVVLSGTLGFRIYKQIMQTVQKTNDGHPFKDLLEAEVAVSDEKAQEVSAAVLQYFNSTALKLRSLFLVEDVFDTVKFMAVLYVFTYIGAWFNGLTLIILAFIALFATPKIYETNKTVIDQYLELLQAKYAEISAKVSAAIPFGKKDKAQ